MTMAVSDNKTHELLIKLCEKLEQNERFQKENSDLKDELETLKKQLGIATEALNSVHYSPINPDAPITTIYQMKDRAKEAISEIMELDNE